MNHLASTNSNSFKLTQFNMSEFFFAGSFLFKKLTISKMTIAGFDTFLAIVLLILFSPILLLVVVAIKISMGGNVFYTQTRIGKHGKNFKIFKFRSMIENAEASTGPMFAQKNDQRVTALGKFLRSSHLDEFPQLLNVIPGDMSFIGPRPERPEFVEVFEKEIADYNLRSRVKPGITGLAQICLPYDALPHEKLEYDLYYIKNQQSVIFNFLISYYTALKMVTFHKNL